MRKAITKAAASHLFIEAMVALAGLKK